jgi:hypothetical protein
MDTEQIARDLKLALTGNERRPLAEKDLEIIAQKKARAAKGQGAEGGFLKKLKKAMKKLKKALKKSKRSDPEAEHRRKVNLKLKARALEEAARKLVPRVVLSDEEKEKIIAKKIRKAGNSLMRSMGQQTPNPNSVVFGDSARRIGDSVRRIFGDHWKSSYKTVLPLVFSFINCQKFYKTSPGVSNEELLATAGVCYEKMWKIARKKSEVLERSKQKQFFWWEGRVLGSFMETLQGLKSEVEQIVGDATAAKLVLLDTVFLGNDWVAAAPGWFAAAVVTGFLCFFAAFLLIAGFAIGYWKDQTPFLMLVGCLFVALALQVTYWTFLGTGYQVFGSSDEVANVRKWQVDLVGRIANVLVMTVLAMFSYVIFSAVVPLVVSAERQKAWRVAMIASSAVVCFACGASGMAMAVVHAFPTNDFIIDASDIVLSACLVLFTGALLAILVMVMLKARSSEDISESAVRSARIFACVAGLALGIFVTRLVFSILWVTVDSQRWENTFLVFQCVTSCFVAAAVIAYFSIQMVSAWRTNAAGRKLEGYVSLNENSRSSELETPEMYQV